MNWPAIVSCVVLIVLMLAFERFAYSNMYVVFLERVMRAHMSPYFGWDDIYTALFRCLIAAAAFWSGYVLSCLRVVDA